MEIICYFFEEIDKLTKIYMKEEREEYSWNIPEAER